MPKKPQNKVKINITEKKNRIFNNNRDFNTSISIIGRTTRQKISKDKEDNTIK